MTIEHYASRRAADAGTAGAAGALGAGTHPDLRPVDPASARPPAGPAAHGRQPVVLQLPGIGRLLPVGEDPPGIGAPAWRPAVGDPGARPPWSSSRRPAVLRERIRCPLAAPAVVAVCAMGGGAGRTTLTVALGQLLAAVRGEPVAAVEAMTAPLGTMGARVAADAVWPLHEVADVDGAAHRPGLPGLSGRAGLRGLPGRPGPTARPGVAGHPGLSVVVGDRPDGRFLNDRTAALALERLAMTFPLVVLDVAAAVSDRRGWWRWAGPDAAVATVLVCRGTAVDLLLAAEALPALVRAGGVEPARVVVVVNQVTGRRMDRQARLAEQLLAAQVPQLVRLPFDRGLAGGREVRLERLARRTRWALERVGAAVASGFSAVPG